MAGNCCGSEIDSLSKELDSLVIKSKQLKAEYQKLLIQNLQKDVEILELQNKSDLQNKSEQQKCHQVEQIISTSAMKQLKLLSDAQKDDSKFIYIILNDLYGPSLKDKTLSGRKKNTAITKNAEITRKIKSDLEICFEERLMNISSDEKQIRMSTLNKLIRTAIDKSKRGECFINDCTVIINRQ